MKILIPVDGSASTARLLEWLATKDPFCSQEHQLVVLHVVASLPCLVARGLSPAALEDYYGAEAQPVWNFVRGFLKAHHVRANCRREVGDAAHWISKLASGEAFDLVVMGSRGHGAIASFVLGSVAAKVLAHCRAPVLLIR
jgi:nucleotide-binding universal stress UspA family protein